MSVFLKVLIGAVLLAILVVLTYLQVPHSERLIDMLYAALIGLGITHIAGTSAPGNKEGGFAHPGMLAALGVGTLLALSACSAGSQTAPDSFLQPTYTRACATYSAGFATVLELRKLGKLTPSEIGQVTLIDSQVTPLCTGALPPDLTTATTRIEGAVAALAVLEATHKGN